MSYFLRILGFIWLLPATILVWLFYISWGWGFGFIKWSGWHSFLIAEFLLVNKDSWYARLWRDWAGWSGPCVIIIKDLPGGFDDPWVERTRAHEGDGHGVQQFIFGPLFYPVYILVAVFMWFFFHDKHAYLDHPFERHARKAAGQQVDIPRHQWMHGPNDRWPWW